MPLKRAGRSQCISDAGQNRSGFWRLLTCTEGSQEDDDIHDRVVRRPSERSSHNRMKAAKLMKKPSKGISERRRKQRSNGDSTEEVVTPAGSGSSSGAERLSRPHRRHRRRHDHRHRCSMRSGTSACRASVLDKLQSKSARGHRRRRKRLVVAMLEDRDDDGATESTRSCGDCGGRRMLRMQATRDERKIRRILHQFSSSMGTADDRQTEFASSLRPVNSPAVQPRSSKIQSHGTTLVPSPMSVPPPPQPLPPHPPPHSLPPPTPPHQPPAHQTQTAPTSDAVSVQPSQLVQPQALITEQQQQQQQQQQQKQQKQQSALPLSQSPQQHRYGVTHFPQFSQAMPDSAFKSGRHGYRLFRRVFSAADNYYAVPFSPLESVRLSKDDDQWEDVEIFVASHKGTETIKPMTSQPQRSVNNQANSRPVVASFAKVVGKPQPAVPPIRLALPRPGPKPQSRKSTEAGVKLPPQPQPKQPRQAMLLAAKKAAANRTVEAGGGDQPFGKSLPRQKTSVVKPQPPPPLLQKQPQPVPKARANRPEVCKTQFNFMNRHQQINQLHQQRRADLLSPHRLLNQLSLSEAPKDPSPMTPSLLPRPRNTTRNSQIPLFRAEPTALSARMVGANRCGKLNTMVLRGLRPK